jgi:hypothetical protein
MESPVSRNKEASPKEESGFKNRQPIKSNEVEEGTKTRKGNEDKKKEKS